jgi:catechol 2,3-dioxygenase-like lactoylglutathione lyase family enzyme/type 1 glutamine amidotransferase
MKRLACVLISAIVFSSIASTANSPIQVLLLDGQSGGPYHNWKLTTPILKKELEDTGLFKVTVLTAPPSDGDFTSFHPEVDKYQVIVSNLDSPSWPENLRGQLEQYIRNGGGLVTVHAADNAFPDWPAYNEMIGIGGWRGRTEKAGPMWYFKEGKLISDPSPGSAGSHGMRRPFQVTAREPEHPILKGLPPVWMHAPDELYATLRGPGKNMTILATAHSEPQNAGTGHDEPILMALNYGKGRVFHTVLGHDATALGCVGFISTFQRGTEWAATGNVTQKIPAAFPTATTVSYRADIVAMDPAIARGSATTATEMVERPSITGISHLTLFADDFAKSQKFYADLVGWDQIPAGALARPGVRFYANHSQYVELVSPLIPGQLDRLDSIAFSTTDVEAMRRFLRAKDVAVPPSLTTDAEGNRSFAVQDPEGNKVVFQQDGDHPPAEPASAGRSLSSHIMHAGYMVRNRAALDHFYKDILGFHLYWQGGDPSNRVDWVMMQVPDGTDWIEYMLYLPAHPSLAQLGSANHLAPGVASAAELEQKLDQHGWKPPGGRKAQLLGVDGKIQIDLTDPDGTRIEFMEYKPVKDPCCSAYTGTQPTPPASW